MDSSRDLQTSHVIYFVISLYLVLKSRKMSFQKIYTTQLNKALIFFELRFCEAASPPAARRPKRTCYRRTPPSAPRRSFARASGRRTPPACPDALSRCTHAPSCAVRPLSQPTLLNRQNPHPPSCRGGGAAHRMPTRSSFLTRPPAWLTRRCGPLLSLDER